MKVPDQQVRNDCEKTQSSYNYVSDDADDVRFLDRETSETTLKIQHICYLERAKDAIGSQEICDKEVESEICSIFGASLSRPGG